MLLKWIKVFACFHLRPALSKPGTGRLKWNIIIFTATATIRFG